MVKLLGMLHLHCGSCCHSIFLNNAVSTVLDCCCLNFSFVYFLIFPQLQTSFSLSLLFLEFTTEYNLAVRVIFHRLFILACFAKLVNSSALALKGEYMAKTSVWPSIVGPTHMN